MRVLKSKWAFTASILAGALLVTTGANAALMVDASVGGAATGASYVNFENLAIGNSGGMSNGVNLSFTGSGQLVTDASSGFYAAPYISNSNGAPFGDATASGPDTTKYVSTGNATATLSFSGMQKYLGLLWGSVDTYNSLEFFMGATSVGLLTGADIFAAANGDQGMMGTYYANISSTLGFDRVVASSSQYAFEFDNVAYGTGSTGVPEPAALGLLGLGLLGLGFRRRQAVKAH